MKLLFFLLFIVCLSQWTEAKTSFTKKKSGENSETWSFLQKINHQSNSTSYFQQRVFISQAQDLNAPIFLEICGEQECNDYFPELVKKLAEKHQGHIVALEHRYYGISHPFEDLGTDNLKFLKTDQVLEDIAYFIGKLRQELKFTGPIVLVGCSYAGNLVSYLRATKPNLSIGALAISAPIRVKPFAPEYDQFKEKKIGRKCAKKLKRQVRLFENMVLNMSDEEFAQTTAVLHFKRAVSKATVIEFLGDLSSNWVNAKKHQVFCDRLSDNPYHLAPFIETFARYIEFSDKYKDSFERAAETNIQKLKPSDNIRQWLYQTCTEYGYFQVSDINHSVGPISKNKVFKEKMCRDFFGVSIEPSWYLDAMKNNVIERARRIVFTNAKDDFWHTLSVLPRDKGSNNSLLVEKGGHCSAFSDFKRGQAGPQAQFLMNAVERWLIH